MLERLENQLDRDSVDPKLLDKLGWTKDDVERFVSRWRQMQEQSRTTDARGEGSRGELDDALRSLGLRPGRVDRRAGRPTDDVRGLGDGYRGTPPADIQEQLKAYIRGTSREMTKEE